MFFWFVTGMHSGTGYPSGIFTHAGTGMGKVFYPCVGTDNLAGKILSRGYGYGIAIPNGCIPVTISRHDETATETKRVLKCTSLLMAMLGTVVQIQTKRSCRLEVHL